MSPKLHYPAIVQLDSTLGSQYPGTPDYLGYQRLLKFPWLRSKLIKNNLQKFRANLINTYHGVLGGTYKNIGMCQAMFWQIL